MNFQLLQQSVVPSLKHIDRTVREISEPGNPSGAAP